MAEENIQTNAPEQDLSEILKVRREKLAALRAEGRDPFKETRFDVTHHAQDIKDNFDALEGSEVRVAGRLMSKRGMGKVSFCDLQDKSGRIQLYARKDEMDEAKRNMDKYADYRTYLSFDMKQIVHGDKEMTIGLSKMIKKNSGGEGQNPLYVALLASFAQLYKINLSPKMHRSPTLRLVVLDEAFSKMDAEKVASCISLIRGLGFQAIISATNDKIQNYLENVDKTFVYANPNKRHISIQEFEKTEFGELAEEE